MLLLAQFAPHPVLKMSTIHQHTSFKPSSRFICVARSAQAQSAICHSTLARRHPLFKQLRGNVIQSKRYSSFTWELSHNFPLSIAYNSVKSLINALSYSPAKIISEASFMKLLEFTRKSSAKN